MGVFARKICQQTSSKSESEKYSSKHHIALTNAAEQSVVDPGSNEPIGDSVYSQLTTQEAAFVLKVLNVYNQYALVINDETF